MVVEIAVVASEVDSKEAELDVGKLGDNFQCVGFSNFDQTQRRRIHDELRLVHSLKDFGRSDNVHVAGDVFRLTDSLDRVEKTGPVSAVPGVSKPQDSLSGLRMLSHD